MARVRTDNVFGTTTDNPLTSGATTMNSAGLANLAAVSSKEAFITLDPNRVNGAPEIVVVTAHTGAATSATIQRGQFGTTARQHAAGTEWVHGPIAGNATTYATAADDQGDYVPVDGWETWAPTLANFTLGSGSVVAKFQRIGRTIHFRFQFTLGAGSAVGTNPTFTLPVAAHADYDDYMPIGPAGYFDDSVGALTSGLAHVNNDDESICVTFRIGGSGSTDVAISSTAPFTWAAPDSFSVTGTYEAAS